MSLRRTMLVAASACVLMTACSADEEGGGKDASRERGWSQQKESVDRARDVGRQLGEAAARKNDAAK